MPVDCTYLEELGVMLFNQARKRVCCFYSYRWRKHQIHNHSQQ